MNYLVVIFVSLLSVSCSGSRTPRETIAKTFMEEFRPNVSYLTLGYLNSNTIIITHDVDLKGGECKLPNNSTLEFKNGVIKNGAMVGSNTKIVNQGAVFDHVTILGSWNVPEISSDLFVDLSYENSLKELFALANPDIHNKITINEGTYSVSALTEWNYCLRVGSNTDLFINGIIILRPNNFKGCEILFVEGKNITIMGTGAIIGDKHTHTGSSGEWGMGIKIHNAHNVKVKGLTVGDCWGDCIYVGYAEHVIIQDCNLKDSRRQGISITAANDVIIKKCRISGIKGTAPEFAIDVEPNKNDTCRNIVMDRIIISDCQGGILSWGGAQGAFVSNLSIKGCILDKIKKSPFRFDKVNNVKVEDCMVSNFGQKNPFTLINLKGFISNNNITR